MQEYIKKFLGSCKPTAVLIVSSDEMEDINNMVKSLEDSGLLLKVVSETIQNEAKEQQRGFLSMLLGKLGATLIGDILAGKRVVGERFLRAGYRSSIKSKGF